MPILVRPPMRAPTGCEAKGFLTVVFGILAAAAIWSLVRGNWGFAAALVAAAAIMAALMAWLWRG